MSKNNTDTITTTVGSKGGNSCLNPQYMTWGPQGWICPRCGRVLSPYMNTCPFCSGGNQFNYTPTSGHPTIGVGDPTITISSDNLHIKSIIKEQNGEKSSNEGLV